LQTLRLTGIEASGRHGFSEGERDQPQPFAVDLVLAVDAAGDDPGSTADYREVARLVRDVVQTTSFSLIETLASRVADEVAALQGVVWCRATVHKPQAAERHGLADISAEATSGTMLPPGDSA
jgi:7,8-dihydroneopterin aldolase/epimerase/oxygenase